MDLDDMAPNHMILPSYRTVARPVHVELVERRSRFLCILLPAADEAAARQASADARVAHPDARHHAFAWRLYEDGRILEHAGDDGEPSGTAGRPMLQVLQRHELLHTAAVVTRYFGGILLGAPGLVRAYGGAVARGVEKAREDGAIAQAVWCEACELDVPYADHERVARALESVSSGWGAASDGFMADGLAGHTAARGIAARANTTVVERSFGAEVTLRLWIPAVKRSALEARVRDLTAGQRELRVPDAAYRLFPEGLQQV